MAPPAVVQKVAQPRIPRSYSEQACVECLPRAGHSLGLGVQLGTGRQGPCSPPLLPVSLFAKGDSNSTELVGLLQGLNNNKMTDDKR